MTYHQTLAASFQITADDWQAMIDRETKADAAAIAYWVYMRDWALAQVKKHTDLAKERQTA